MSTKAEERKALEQIRKIVAALGTNSYVGTAMEGVLEIAEQNIEWDTAFSVKGEKELAEKNEAKAKEELRAAKQMRDELQDAYDVLKADHEALEVRYNHMVEQLNESHDNCITNWNNFRAEQDRADALESEIIKLKAKLYDLMMADK